MQCIVSETFILLIELFGSQRFVRKAPVAHSKVEDRYVCASYWHIIIAGGSIWTGVFLLAPSIILFSRPSLQAVSKQNLP